MFNHRIFLFAIIAVLAGAGGYFFKDLSGGVLSATLRDVYGGNNFKLAAEIGIGGDFQGNTTENRRKSAILKPEPKENKITPSAVNLEKGINASSTIGAISGFIDAKNGSEPKQISFAGELKDAEDKPLFKECGFAGGANSTHRVLFNEIAWMGSAPLEGESSNSAASREWVELKNNSAADVNLAGWQILNDDGSFKISFSEEDVVEAGAFYLLERKSDASLPGISADKIYTGALSNAGEWLVILNKNCELIDEVDSQSGWPAGDNASKKTLARSRYDFSWYTSGAPGGTPGEENTDASIGTSGGSITAGVPQQSVFNGSTTNSSAEEDPPIGVGAILISEIFYDAEGGDSGKEFIELYNPNSVPIDMSAWSLRRDGNSLALIGQRPEDKKIISASGFFLIGFSDYNGIPEADITRSSSLPNTGAVITIQDTGGNIINSVSYNQSVSAGQSWERNPLTGSQFIAQSNPNPQNSGL